eukprot:GHVL01002204.1.p1 GENE.GHVL01002204.1~~GHVL01002204.1.p1  ORF type:complete len:102 (+),score=16.75 GHVL01002204.1:32-307(+)
MASQTKTTQIIQLKLTEQSEQQCDKIEDEKNKKNEKKVEWQEDTVDNECMGKRKSKKCCVYHRRHKFGESSTDSESSILPMPICKKKNSEN